VSAAEAAAGAARRRPRPRLAARHAAIALVALALLVRLAFLAATPDFVPHLDSAHYDGLACGLVLGEGYALRTPSGRTADSCGRRPQGENPPTAFRPPGWPAALAGVYAVSERDRWTAGRVLNALIGTVAVALIGALAWALLGPAAGLAALALAAVDTTLVVTGASLLSEPLAVALITAALLVAARVRGAPAAGAAPAAAAPAAAAPAAAVGHRRGPLRALFAAGVLLGLATLVRSNALVLVPAVALLTRAGWRGAAVVALGCVLAVAPWTVRNAVQMDSFVPVASYFGSGLSGTFNETTRTRTDYPGGWMSPRNVPEFQALHRSGRSELDKQAELRERAIAYAADHPGYVVTAGLRNAARMLSLSDTGWHRGNAEALSLPRWTGTLAAIGFWLVLAAAALGARRIPAALWLAAGLLIVSAMWFGGELRYRAPLMPVVLLAASAAISRGRWTRS
jgi:hypothetical protein